MLLAGLKGSAPIAALSNASIVAHIAKRRATRSNGTVNREIQLLRRALKYAGSALDAAVPEINWRDLKLKEPTERVRELTAAEEGRLFKHLRQDFHPLVRFALITGCRVGNAVRLEWRDVDFATGVIVFREMKGDRHHAIPMTRTVVALISSQPRVHERVFTYWFRGGKKRRPFTIAGWKKPWRAALAAAGIKDFRFHDTRHTALSRVARVRGLKAAQKLAGHASIASTARYDHCEMEELRATMEAVETTRTGPTAVRRGTGKRRK